MTVQPLACKDTFAAKPAGPGAEDVPPSMFTVPFDCPAVSRETRMLSTDCWERAQPFHVLLKEVARQLSNIPAGNTARLEQKAQQPSNCNPDPKFKNGKEAREVQSDHVPENCTPELTFKTGKEVNPGQSDHALLKFSPELTSRRGKEVRLVQLYHAPSKFTPELTSRAGKEVRLVQ